MNMTIFAIVYTILLVLAIAAVIAVFMLIDDKIENNEKIMRFINKIKPILFEED